MHARTRRAVAVAMVLVGALAVTPAAIPAPAPSVPKVRFVVSITGTFHSTGSLSDDCRDAADSSITTQRVAETTWTFASTRPGRAEFVLVQGDVDAGTTREMTVAATGVRTATESPACAPQFTDDVPFGSTCSTRHATYRMSLYGSGTSARVGYGIDRGLGRPLFPDDPWDSRCPPLGIAWTKLSVDTAPPTIFSRARLFDSSVRRIVVHGRRTGGLKQAGARSSWTLTYAITLTRRRG